MWGQQKSGSWKLGTSGKYSMKKEDLILFNNLIFVRIVSGLKQYKTGNFYVASEV